MERRRKKKGEKREKKKKKEKENARNREPEKKRKEGRRGDTRSTDGFTSNESGGSSCYPDRQTAGKELIDSWYVKGKRMAF